MPNPTNLNRKTPPLKKGSASNNNLIITVVAGIIIFLIIATAFVLSLFLYIVPSIGNTARDNDINHISNTLESKLIAQRQALPVNPLQSKIVLDEIEYEYYTDVWEIHWDGRPVNTDKNPLTENLAIGQRPPTHLQAHIKERDNVYIWSKAECDQDNIPIGSLSRYSFAIHFAKELQDESICYTVK